MSKTATETPDAVLKRLRRLDSNMTCPNCGTPAQRGIGFGNVCVKFGTFICDLCKTSHQAISHQVKSITMSNWTMEEVNKLTDARGGGNAAALHVWLAKAPAYGARYPGGARPKQGDKVEIFKQFVLDCYEYGNFRADTPYVPQSSGGATPVPPTPGRSSPVPASSVSVPAPVAMSAVVAPAPASLPKPSSSASFASDFDLFGNSGTSSPVPPTTANARSARTQSTDPFTADFVSFDAFPASTTGTTGRSSGGASPARPAAAPAPAPKPSVSQTALIDLLDVDFPPSSTPSNPASKPQSGGASPFGPSSSSLLDVPAAPTASSSSTKSVLDLFDGLSFDAHASTPTTGSNGLSRVSPVPMGGPAMSFVPPVSAPLAPMSAPLTPMSAPLPPTAPRPYNANAISQLFPSSLPPAGAMRSVSGPPAYPTSTMGPGAGMTQTAYPGTPSVSYAPRPSAPAPSSVNSFDFLQETMRQQVDSASSGASTTGGAKAKPVNPFL